MTGRQKLLAVMLAAVAVGSGAYYFIPRGGEVVAPKNAAVSTSAEAATPIKGARSLIVYFTYSENIGDTSGMNIDAVTAASLHGEKLVDEGNMQVMVKEIANKTGADTYSIVKAKPYAVDFENMTNVAKAEIEENLAIELKNPLPDFSRYDVIYLGTPIWWYTIPQPVKVFLEQADLAGKTIVPFGIHRGSGFNNNLETIAELAPKARLTADFTIDAKTKNSDTRAQFDEFLDKLSK